MDQEKSDLEKEYDKPLEIPAVPRRLDYGVRLPLVPAKGGMFADKTIFPDEEEK